VRVKALVFKTKPEYSAQAPKSIKIVINRQSISFDDIDGAADSEVAQALDLSEAQATGGAKIPLRFVRFQSVNSLHV
jgi:hypothetical protein